MTTISGMAAFEAHARYLLECVKAEMKRKQKRKQKRRGK